MAKAKTMKVNFTGVDKEIKKGGGGGVRIPEGDYKVKVVDVSLEEGPKANYLRWTVQITEGKHKGKKIRTNTSLKKEALWNLRNLIHAALGTNVAGKSVNFDPQKLIGKIVGAAIVDGEEYKHKIRSEVQTFMPKGEVSASTSDDDDDEDEEDTDEEETEEVEEEEDEDLDEVEVEDL